MFLIGYIAGFLFNCEYPMREYPYFGASLHNQQPVSTAGFLTGKVFLFGWCEPLCCFRYIDSLLHLHLEIITIYMSTSIFMYTCHMFSGSFQNQGSILNYIYLYILHINLQCALQKGTTFCLGPFFQQNITDQRVKTHAVF